MKRIFTLAMTLMMIGSLAWVENSEPIDKNPTAYRINIGNYKLLVVTPLDENRTVLLGVKKPLQKEPDSYLAEGVMGLTISRIAKMAGEPASNKKIDKYVKEMVKARALALKEEVTEEESW